MLLTTVLAVAAAFALWQIHLKLAYRGAYDGIHSVTINHYSQTLAQKSSSLILETAVHMLTRLLHRGPHLLCLAAYAGTFALAWASGKPRGEWLTGWKNAVLFTGCVLVLWYISLFFTYVFSMSAEEAQSLASIRRYEYSGVIYTLGVMLVFALLCVGDREWNLSPAKLRLLTGGLLAAFCLAMAFPSPSTSLFSALLSTKDGHSMFGFIRQMRENNRAIEEGKRYMFFQRYDSGLTSEDLLIYRNLTKYEFFSNELMGIYHGEALVEMGGESDWGYRLNLEYNHAEHGYIHDVSAFLTGHIDDYDYLLVYDYDPEFEAVLNEFLKDYSGDTQICYSYR